MNKSNQSEPSRHNVRRLSAVVGILVSAALMAGPLMSFADDSASQNSQTQDSQTTAQTGEQSADGQANSNGGVTAAKPGINNTQAPKSQAKVDQSAGDDKAKTNVSQGAEDGNSTKEGAQAGSATPNAQDQGTDVKPQLAAMLAYNKRANTGDDQLRMDFVLRVKHDSVNPYAQGVGQWSFDGKKTNLQLFYSDGNSSARKQNKLRRMIYLQTITNNPEEADKAKLAAAQWSRNKADFFTIHSIKQGEDGYDYLSISAQGRVWYPKDNTSKVLGGGKYDRQVYAVVGKNINVNSCGTSNGDCEVDGQQITGDEQHATNLTDKYPIYLYNTDCKGDDCAGPLAYAGNGGDTSLFSGGQANWGLHVDNGISEADQSKADKTITDPGVAPAKSFFTFWTNPGGDTGSQHQNVTTCGNTTSFYYEWFGLKGGNWVPVTELNTKALSSNGQTPAKFDSSPIGSNTFFSYNAKDDTNPARTLIADTSGNNEYKKSVQNADGSINFAQAKADQGFDGYFKMVAWPTSTDASGKISKACVATDAQGANKATMKDIYNPLYSGNEEGISKEMAEKHPEQAQYLMNLGFDVNTVFDGYGYQGVNVSDNQQAPKTTDNNKNSTKPLSPDDPIHTPVMAQMLGYNDKIDTEGDEIRADFVVKVARDDVNPSCIGLGANDQRGIFWNYMGDDKDQAHGIDVNSACGMKMTYWYGKTAGKNKNTESTRIREAKYFNTWSSDNKAENTDANKSNANYWWARNVGANNYDFFTIRDVQYQGPLAYLTITLTGDVDYEDIGDTLGGTQQPLQIDLETGIGTGKTYKNRISQGYMQQVYRGKSCSSKDSANCGGPISSLAYDETHPTFWSGGEANWGLTLDQGFDTAAPPVRGQGARTAPGIAPSNTFFTRWYNPDVNNNQPNLCNKVNNYYFQWFALKNGDEWEPVKELTPTAQKMDQPGDAGTSGGDTQRGSRVNEPRDYRNPYGWQENDHGGLLASGDAQKPDGSIDFGVIKGKHPDYNGYFKMLTWPISTNSDGDNSSCVAGPGVSQAVQDVYNPLYNAKDKDNPKGATEKMSQGNIKAIMAKGWTVNTVFDDYSYSSAFRNDSKVKITSVDMPHTVKATGDIAEGERKLVISGTDTHRPFSNSNVDLYAVYMGDKTVSDPSAEVSQDDLKNLIKSGTKLGSVDIGKPGDADWSVTVTGQDFENFLSHVKDSQSYRFIAYDACYDKVSEYTYLDQQMDMTPPEIKAPKINYWKLQGKLTESDVYNGFDKVKVDVTWGPNESDVVETTVDSSGVWKVTLPQDFKLGHNVKIDVTDPSGNQSKTYTCFVPKPVKNLPYTGSWLLWLLLLLFVLATAEVIYRRYKHNKEQAGMVTERGGVIAQRAVSDVARSKGPRHVAHTKRRRR